MLYRKMKKADPELSLLGFGAMRLPECFELYNLRAPAARIAASARRGAPRTSRSGRT
ncbi:MAG: hypothetical protein LUQ60_03640 [Methanomicrobiales archaeon]|nr:hypothetical protein [Methanomicrobiales archaeon]